MEPYAGKGNIVDWLEVHIFMASGFIGMTDM